MNHVTRINLKTNTDKRQELIDYCLRSKPQKLAIGWSRIFEGRDLTFEEYYQIIKSENNRAKPVLNRFKEARIDDLYWTRDLNGIYWICRVTGPVETHLNEELDIGAILPVEAYSFGMQVPGQIKASFNRPRGGTAQKIAEPIITEYSKLIYNRLSGNSHYEVKKMKGSLLDNLPDFDLEELVLSYLQIKEDYFILSNSIAKKSTTIKIECEMISRSLENPRKAVVQVKGKKAKALDAKDYREFTNKVYIVYLYAPEIQNLDEVENVVEITQEEIMEFYHEYKSILPESIVRWENIIE